MNKKIIKKELVIVFGEIITLITMCLYIIEANYMIKNINYYLYESNNIFLIDKRLFFMIFSLFLIIIGINLDKKDKNKKINKLKYNLLKLIGLLPFLNLICVGIYYMFKGYQLYTNGFNDIYIYGLKALLFTIIRMSIILWPLYIIGIFLIIVGTKNKTK